MTAFCSIYVGSRVRRQSNAPVKQEAFFSVQETVRYALIYRRAQGKK